MLAMVGGLPVSPSFLSPPLVSLHRGVGVRDDRVCMCMREPVRVPPCVCEHCWSGLRVYTFPEPADANPATNCPCVAGWVGGLRPVQTGGKHNILHSLCSALPVRGGSVTVIALRLPLVTPVGLVFHSPFSHSGKCPGAVLGRQGRRGAWPNVTASDQRFCTNLRSVGHWSLTRASLAPVHPLGVRH